MRYLFMCGVAVCSAAILQAGVTYTFESTATPSFNGTSTGTPLNFQGSSGGFPLWVNTPTSCCGNVFTYSGNTAGVPQDPNGGSQFIDADNINGTTRTQDHMSVNFNANQGPLVGGTFSYDFAALYNGATANATANQDFAQLQLDDSGGLQFEQQFLWTAAAGGVNQFQIVDFAYNSAGVLQTFVQAFSGLSAGVWYHVTVQVDGTNTITAETITALTGSGAGSTQNSADSGLFFQGGQNNPQNTTGFQLFADITDHNNPNRSDFALDNLGIANTPEPGTLVLLGSGLVILGMARRLRA
jgi:hypothetical protein